MRGENKCTFSAKRNLGIYFAFSVFTFFISEKRLPLFDFPFCNPNSDFGFYISQLRFSFRSYAFRYFFVNSEFSLVKF